MVGTGSYDTLFVRTSHAHVCLDTRLELKVASQGPVTTGRLQLDAPFCELNNTPVLGPSKPAWARLPLFFLIEHSDDARCVAVVWSFGYTPNPKVAV